MKITVLDTEREILLTSVAPLKNELARDIINTRSSADVIAAREGNMLVENAENEYCLEISSSARLRFDDDCVIALTGALFSVSINSEAMPHYCAAQVDKGDEMIVETSGNGGYLYVSVNGIFEYEKSSLTAGDEIQISENSENLYNMDIRFLPIPESSENEIIRLLPGQYASDYGMHILELLYTTEFTVSGCDRKNLRLSGVDVGRPRSLGLPAYAPVGSVLLDENGAPYILMQDSCALTEEKIIATVITHDISRVAQLKMGDKVRFSPCTVQASQKLIAYTRKEYIRNYLTLNEYQLSEVDAEEEDQ